jgi:hypothetical protein
MKDLLKGWFPMLMALTACDGTPGPIDAGAAPAVSSWLPSTGTPAASTGAASAVTPVASFMGEEEDLSSTPDELWDDYQKIHARVSLDNTFEIGKELDALLNYDARELLTITMSNSLRSMNYSTPSAPAAFDQLRYGMFGQRALHQQPKVSRYRLGEPIIVSPDRAILLIYEGPELRYQLSIVRKGDDWRFTGTTDLLALYYDPDPLPRRPGDPEPRTYSSPQAAASAFVDAFNADDARALYDLLDLKTKAYLNRHAAFNSSGDDVLAIIRNVLGATRTAHGAARVLRIKFPSPDHADLMLVYDSGLTEPLAVIRENDTWRVRLIK